MPHIEKVKVWWPEEFGHQQVQINKADFDPAKHSLEAPKAEAIEGRTEEAEGEFESLPPIEENEGVELRAEPKRKTSRPKSK